MITIPLPYSILRRAEICGEDLGWPINSIKFICERAKNQNIAISGGHVHLCFKNDNFALYWLKIDIHEKQAHEAWNDFVERSNNQFINEYEKILANHDILEESVNSFPKVKKLIMKVDDPQDIIYFVIHFLTEDTKKI